jgi:hypothetical protein
MGHPSPNHNRPIHDPKGETMQILNRKTGRKGQGLVEYILVVFLMAIGSIAIVKAFGAVVQSGFILAGVKLVKEFV